MKYFVVGLGNPEGKYMNTRHNVAWIILEDLLPLDWGFNKYINADVLTESVADGEVLYVLPKTYMNRSGQSIMSMKDYYPDFDIDKLIVIYDDLDLPLGTVRVSYDRGAAGHNGIRSIQNNLKTREFIRIRVGVSKDIDGTLVKPNVLGNFEPQELAYVKGPISQRVDDILHTIYKDGYQVAMNTYNSKNPGLKF